MRRKMVLAWMLVGIPVFLFLNVGNARGQLKVGVETSSFTLPSSQGQLVDYYKEYYGKHHLILTFFPAAFTPV